MAILPQPPSLTTNKRLADLSVHDLCRELELDESLFDLKIDVPVGFTLEVEGPVLPNPGDVAGKLLGKLNTALAPFVPIFDGVETLLVLVDVLDAVSSLNPIKILDALKKFIAKVDKFKKLIPQLSLPITIKGTVKVLLVLVVGFKAELLAIAAAQAKVDLAAARAIALGNADLTAAVDCAQADVDFSIGVVANNAAPLNRLLTTLNLFCKIAGLPELPTLTFEAGASVNSMLTPLDALADALQTVHDAIPV